MGRGWSIQGCTGLRLFRLCSASQISLAIPDLVPETPRMTYFIVSDLHLVDHEQSFMFNSRKERVFVKLVDEILAREATLVCAGDIFDLTSMTPCRFGMREFFNEALPTDLVRSASLDAHCLQRTDLEMLAAVRAKFPEFVDALATLARLGKLTIIPGNHDCILQYPEGQAILASVLGVTPERISWPLHLQIGDFAIAAHGNEFDPSNQTQRSCQNPGAVITSALYHGVMPALKILGVPDEIANAVPAVRPEEAIVTGIQHYLDEETTRHLLIAFVRLLDRNGYFRGIGKLPMWFLLHEIPLLSSLVRLTVTPARIRSALPKEERLKQSARSGAESLRLSSEAAESTGVRKIAVLGHTHELDLQDDYVNLGTWIDHISGLSPEKIKQAECTLPVLVIEPNGGEAFLADVNKMILGAEFKDCPVLWRAPR
jgi:UDP-2,3-diacylglucosamine pyrophosphatase LpxH